MPPPLFRPEDVAFALRDEAMPALELFAKKRNHTFRRFERYEPPPYASSTEEEEEGEAWPPYSTLDLREGDDAPRPDPYLEPPLDDKERDDIARHLEHMKLYLPGKHYEVEAERERDRVHIWAKHVCTNSDIRNWLVQLGLARKGRAGRERTNIIARHNIKRRWQKLGVWNPEWGIPENANNPQPSDDVDTWKWQWQHGDSSATWHSGSENMALNMQHPVMRALRRREGVGRNQHKPQSPHRHIDSNASASQAESFIISRPWFVYTVELLEEQFRQLRIPPKLRRVYKPSAFYVSERWKQGDEWETKEGNEVLGWKWRRESPSPEPEDLEGLCNFDSFEFTPSEIDALDAVRPSTPSPPPLPRPPEPQSGLFSKNWVPPEPGSLADEPELAEEQPSPPPPSPPLQQPSSPPRQPRRRSRRQPQDIEKRLPPRRSARIAAMAAKELPLESPQRPQQQQQQQQQHRRSRRTKMSDSSGVSKPQKRTKQLQTSARPKRKGGRQAGGKS